MNNYSPMIIGIAAFAVLAVLFTAVHLAKLGLDKTGTWMRAHPLQSGLWLAALMAIAVTVWASQNQSLIECWPQHKLGCFFMTHSPQ